MKTVKLCDRVSVRASLTFGVLVAMLVLTMAVALVIRVRGTFEQRKALAEARRELRVQETLQPLYIELERAVAAPLGSALPCPSKHPLARTDIISIPDRFAKVAGMCRLKLGAVRPHLDTDVNPSRNLQVEVQATGSYGQLRAFMLGVMAWPSFQRFERIEIRQNQMSEEFHLGIRLMLD